MKDVPWTFTSWIAKFEGVDLPIGDLAKDIAADPDFPEGDYFADIMEYLGLKSGHSSAVLETFSTVWNFYLASAQ